MSTPQEVIIRPLAPADSDRVIHQWLSSYRNSPWAGVVPNNIYNQVYAETIRQLLTRGAKVLVACNARSPEHLVGFIAYEVTPRDRILHYVFIRPGYRSEYGICNQLLTAAGFNKENSFVYTFRHFGSKLITGGRYMPELARRQYAHKAQAS